VSAGKPELSFHKTCQADLCSELFDQEQAAIGGEVFAVEIYFDLLIAFKG